MTAVDTDRLWTLVRDVEDFPTAGVTFKDLTPLLADRDGFRAVVDAFVAAAAELDVTHVVGIEARGFLLGTPVALELGAGFVPARKEGKLPWSTRSVSYDLEYGSATLEIHTDAFGEGDRVLVVDDVLATGGTAAATVELVRGLGAQPVACHVLLELGFLDGRAALGDLPVWSLLTA